MYCMMFCARVAANEDFYSNTCTKKNLETTTGILKRIQTGKKMLLRKSGEKPLLPAKEIQGETGREVWCQNKLKCISKRKKYIYI